MPIHYKDDPDWTDRSTVNGQREPTGDDAWVAEFRWHQAEFDAAELGGEIEDAWATIKPALDARNAELLGQIILAVYDAKASRLADVATCGTVRHKWADEAAAEAAVRMSRAAP